MLSNRLKVALGEIIDPDQVGYMANRYCGENVKLKSDVIDYCQFYDHDYPCLILLADFEKAFDTIKWSFLKAALKAFRFGPVFQCCITILYTNIESCVTNNGHLSKYFKLWRGIRQGCPISALLFLLVAEIIAITFRQSENVRGINVNGSMIKLCQLADDMTLFLTDLDSVRNTVNIFEEFYRYAGLKLNKTKTVVFLINPKHVHLKDESLDTKYTDKPFKSLGIWFSSDPAESALLNTTAKINIIKNIIKSWWP